MKMYFKLFNCNTGRDLLFKQKFFQIISLVVSIHMLIRIKECLAVVLNVYLQVTCISLYAYIHFLF